MMTPTQLIHNALGLTGILLLLLFTIHTKNHLLKKLK